MEKIRKALYYRVRLRLRDRLEQNFVLHNKQPFTEFDTGIPKTSQVSPLAVFLGLHMKLVNRTWSVTATGNSYMACL
jgi:hypothetical protein